MNLRDYLLILRRRKWIGIVVLAASLGTAATLTTLATPLYQARASLFVGPQAVPVDDRDPTLGFSASLGVAERLTKTYAQMIRSLPVAELAVEEEALPVAPEYVANRVFASTIAETQLIEITVVDADPTLAANMANATAEAFVDLANRLTSPPGETNPVVPVALFERAAVPGAPVSPDASRNLALAAVLGLLAGLALMFAAEFLDVAVHGPEDVERVTNLPVLALIPRIGRDDLAPEETRAPVRVAP